MNEYFLSLLRSHAHLRLLKKQSILYEEGEKADHLFIVQQGKVKIMKSISEGKTLTLEICTPYDMISETVLFLDTVFTTRGVILETSSIFELSKENFEQLVTKHPRLAVDYMKWLGDKIRKNELKLRDLLLFGKKGAVYSTLIRLAHTYGKVTPQGIEIEKFLTYQEYGELSGVSRENVNRILSDLQRDRVLTLYSDKLVIHQLSVLQREISCEECPIHICKF